MPDASVSVLISLRQDHICGGPNRIREPRRYVTSECSPLLTVLHQFGLFFGAWSPSSCERGRWLLPALPFLVIPASQLLLGIRAYSVWGRSRWLIALLAIPWMFTLAAHVYTINDTSGCKFARFSLSGQSEESSSCTRCSVLAQHRSLSGHWHKRKGIEHRFCCVRLHFL